MMLMGTNMKMMMTMTMVMMVMMSMHSISFLHLWYLCRFYIRVYKPHWSVPSLCSDLATKRYPQDIFLPSFLPPLSSHSTDRAYPPPTPPPPWSVAMFWLIMVLYRPPHPQISGNLLLAVGLGGWEWGTSSLFYLPPFCGKEVILINVLCQN